LVTQMSAVINSLFFFLDFAPVNLSNKKTKNEDIDQGWQSSCFWGKKSQ